MPTIRENLRTLRAVIEAVPLEKFDLSSTSDIDGCGTTFCVFGWAAACGRFPGLVWTHACGMAFGQVQFNGRNTDYDDYLSDLDVLFGEGSHGVLFQCAGYGSLDKALGCPEDWNYSSWQERTLALARIDAQLERYP